MSSRSVRSQIESGVELLARLSDKPSLRGLEDNLFAHGLRTTDIIEIGGTASTGKTILLSTILAKCILPVRHGNLEISAGGTCLGLGATAVLINTDHHFQTLKLRRLMVGIVREACSCEADLMTQLVRDGLRNLTILECYDSEQLLLTLHTLDNILMSTTNVVLLAVDGIAAYYWQDREANGTTSIESYIRNLLKLLGSHTSRCNVVTAYTRLREHPPDVGCTKRPNDPDYKIFLNKLGGSQEYICQVESAKITKHMKYFISDSGIKWQRNGNQG